MKHVVASSAATMLVGKKNVAVVGGGITGSLAASILVGRTNCTNDQKQQQQQPQRINVALFDQGRSGVGGRTSTRRQRTDTTTGCWDHGCQFFRADTPRFKKVVEGTWIKHGICREWNARFASDDESNGTNDFFGLPSHPPFYIGSGWNAVYPQETIGAVRFGSFECFFWNTRFQDATQRKNQPMDAVRNIRKRSVSRYTGKRGAAPVHEQRSLARNWIRRGSINRYKLVLWWMAPSLGGCTRTVCRTCPCSCKRPSPTVQRHGRLGTTTGGKL